MIVLNRIAEAYKKTGEPAKSAGAYERVLKLNPNLLAADLELARLYAGPLHNPDKALEFAKKGRELAPNDPLAANELNLFERARDPSHTRVLADVDLRQLFESNGLVLVKAEFVREARELDPYLDLAGCEGEAREQARALAPPDYTAELGWYLLRRP